MKNKMARISILLALVVTLFQTGAGAQVGTHYGAQALIVHDSNPNNELSGIAVDSSGNLIVADPGTNSVYKETLSNGVYTESVLFSNASNGLKQPASVTIDSSGDIYISDGFNERVLKETLSGGVYTQSLVTDFHGGLIFPEGISVDSNGNVYVCDFDNNRVLKETFTGVGYTQSLVGSGLKTPGAVAVDSSGNVYIADSGNSRVLKETLSGGSYTQSVIAADNSFVQGFAEVGGVAVDGNGNVYMSGDNFSGIYDTSILKATPQAGGYELSAVGVAITAAAQVAVDSAGSVYITGFFTEVTKLSWPSTNFGPVNVTAAGGGSPFLIHTNAQGNSAPVLSFPFTRGNDQPRLSGGAAVSLGVAGEFTDTGTGTCDTNGPNHAYVAGETCTINVSFNPQFAGTRKGAVEFLDKFNNVVATEFITGVGVGPAVAFSPGTLSVVASGFVSPSSVAVNGSGIVFIADPGNRGFVYLETPSGNGYTQTALNEGGGAQPSQLPLYSGVAVDGAGNFFFSDSFGQNVYVREYYNGVVYASALLAYTTQGNGLKGPQGLATDTNGGVYIADTGNNRVVEDNYVSGITYNVGANFELQFVVDSNLNAPQAVAVDGNGNVYIADTGNNRVVKDTPTGSGFFTQSVVVAGLNAPGGVAVDDLGNVYISDTGNHRVLEETVSGSSYTQSVVIGTGLGSPTGLTLDASGNLFIADAGNKNVVKLTSSAPSLTFASTAVGSTSSDSPQTVTLENIGNAALMFPIPGTGTNPSISTGFTLNSVGGTACPLLTSSSGSSASVPANTSCTLPISFTPTTGGNISGSLVISDNSVNLGATQTIALNGAATGAVQTTPTITWPTPAAITYGTALTTTQLDATASVLGTFVYTPASGVLTVGVQTLSVVFTPTDTTDFTTATATVQLTVNQAIPSITWIPQFPITYGTPLGAAQFNATASVPGTFVYTPSSGVLTAGVHTITAVFTPTDTTDYTNFTDTVQFTVDQAIPSITWIPQFPITYGTALGAAQFNATASVPGTFVYTPSSGVLTAGSHTITAVFTPTDATDYTSFTETVQFTVNRALLTVSANSTSRAVGAANPAFTATYNGFVNGDTPAVLSGSPALSTTATTSGPAGTYPITVTQGTLAAENYNFTFINGTLSVVTAPTIILTTTATLTAVTNGYQATVTVANSGTGPASNVTITSATLGAASGSPVPQNGGTIAAGSSITFTVTFPASAGAPGSAVPEKYAGTYTGGSFAGSVRAATLP
ncbi:MAG TPA: MBG domain-containing protein [Acidobacteriaceae bacterium]|nr:MBG domain-containing protein [Acidobacteriaceae bacterium]